MTMVQHIVSHVRCAQYNKLNQPKSLGSVEQYFVYIIMFMTRNADNSKHRVLARGLRVCVSLGQFLSSSKEQMQPICSLYAPLFFHMLFPRLLLFQNLTGSDLIIDMDIPGYIVVVHLQV